MYVSTHTRYNDCTAITSLFQPGNKRSLRDVSAYIFSDRKDGAVELISAKFAHSCRNGPKRNINLSIGKKAMTVVKRYLVCCILYRPSVISALLCMHCVLMTLCVFRTERYGREARNVECRQRKTICSICLQCDVRRTCTTYTSYCQHCP